VGFFEKGWLIEQKAKISIIITFTVINRIAGTQNASITSTFSLVLLYHLANTIILAGEKL
jgi:hypothetical protein